MPRTRVGLPDKNNLLLRWLLCEERERLGASGVCDPSLPLYATPTAKGTARNGLSERIKQKDLRIGALFPPPILTSLTPVTSSPPSATSSIETTASQSRAPSPTAPSPYNAGRPRVVAQPFTVPRTPLSMYRRTAAAPAHDDMPPQAVAYRKRTRRVEVGMRAPCRTVRISRACRFEGFVDGLLIATCTEDDAADVLAGFHALKGVKK